MRFELLIILMLTSTVSAALHLETEYEWGSDRALIMVVSDGGEPFAGEILIDRSQCVGELRNPQLLCSSMFPPAPIDSGNMQGYYFACDPFDPHVPPVFGIGFTVDLFLSGSTPCEVMLFNAAFELVDKITVPEVLEPFVVADADGPYEARPGESVTFDASGSSYYGVDGIDFYNWYVDNTSVGGGETLSLSYDELVTRWSLSQGSHEVRLIVSSIVEIPGGPEPEFYEVSSENTTSLEIHPPLPELKVMSPDGGEEILVGSDFEIKWESVGPVGTVRIEITPNAGADWYLLDSGVADTGSYMWGVAEEWMSPDCLIRISDEVNPAEDQSDGLFQVFVCALKYDLNGDCEVDLRDIALLLSEWLAEGNPFAYGQ